MSERTKQTYLEELQSLQSFMYDVAEDILNETSEEEMDELPEPEDLLMGILVEVTGNPEDLPDYEPLIAEINKESVMFEIEEGMSIPLYNGDNSSEDD